MTVPNASVVYDVYDFKVYPLLTDDTGGIPTYGPGIDVPGIADVSLDPNVVTAELKGDSRIMAKRGRVDRMNLSATYGKLSTPVLAVILGNYRSVDTGTTPNQQSQLLVGSGQMPYFKSTFQIRDVEEGLSSIDVTLYKCQVTGGTLFKLASEQFGQPSFQAQAIAINGTFPAVDADPAFQHPMMEVLFNEFLADLPGDDTVVRTSGWTYLSLTPTAGDDVVFTASTPGLPDLQYTWDFGDGSPVEHGDTATHAYTPADDYTATLTVVGATPGSTTHVITVAV